MFIKRKKPNLSEANMKSIEKIAKKLHIKKNDLFLYGKNMAKVENKQGKKNGKLILVTAITPTPFGEGKTTVSIGLADALNKLKKNTCLTLREPSLGPVFGIKGGATGGGKAQVEPFEDINLHFTGDMHAITSANNLLASIIDNHIYQGNQLELKEVVFHRCIDINDRFLRHITLHQVNNGETLKRNENFVITASSEVMAILSISENMTDLKNRLGNILVGFNKKSQPVYARDLKAENAMAILLKDAIKPNLVQTKEGSPCLIHCGPFGNIAHGCNSVLATKFALSHADYCVTEAGFGSDLGAEKFFDFKCRIANLNPALTVIVCTERALRHQGEGDVTKGCANLLRHYNNLTKIFGQNVVCAINTFDDDCEHEKILDFCKKHKISCTEIAPYHQGGKGCLTLANEVINQCEKKSRLIFSYPLNKSIEEKTEMIVKKVYGGKGIVLTETAKKSLKKIEKIAKNLPIIIAKTQYSFSDDPKLLNAPTDFVVTIKDFELRNGAGQIVAIAGNILLLPGLSKHPASEHMTIDENGIHGLK